MSQVAHEVFRDRARFEVMRARLRENSLCSIRSCFSLTVFLKIPKGNLIHENTIRKFRCQN